MALLLVPSWCCLKGFPGHLSGGSGQDGELQCKEQACFQPSIGLTCSNLGRACWSMDGVPSEGRCSGKVIPGDELRGVSLSLGDWWHWEVQW